uniref:Uncharacterized protein n=1 Tax=Musa acuminata subsp. malaccensis TaxID=214687 RepID=A0A804IVF6_MUSAM
MSKAKPMSASSSSRSTGITSPYNELFWCERL